MQRHMSTITRRQPDPRWPTLLLQLDLSCGHTATRDPRRPPKQRVLCDICHPRHQPPSGPYVGRWATERSRRYDAVRQERGNRALRRWYRHTGKALY